jgi:AcrR family transcriptional regulator
MDQNSPSSRDKILEVSEALFARRGFAGVGLREVAERVGLGKSSLFHHFRSKAQLYLAVLDRVLVHIEERLIRASETGGTPLERLDRMVDALIDALAEQPASARLLLRSLFEEDDFPIEAAAEAEATDRIIHRILARIDGLLREGMQVGAFHNASAAHTIQTLIGATVYHFASGEFGEVLTGRPLLSSDAVRRRKDEVKALIHHGLAAPAAG